MFTRVRSRYPLLIKMDSTHEAVDKIVREKKSEKAKAELLKLANQDIETFILSCRMSGFKQGLKAGFWIGMVVAIIIYFVIN